MQKILGIDIGATAVKAVAIEAGYRTHELRAYRAEPIPPAVAPAEGEAPLTWAERVAPVLQAFADDDWFRADSVVCCLPGAQVASHLVTLPFGDQKRIDATLKFEIEALIPFDLEDVVFDAHVVSRSPTKTEMLVAVARKEDVQALLDVLSQVGVDPNVVTFSALSLASFYGAGYVRTPAPTLDQDGETPRPVSEAIVDIGAERTNVLITEGGQVRFARTFTVAGKDVTRAIARAANLSFEEAEARKLQHELGGGDDPAVAAAADRAAAGFVRELRSTFAAYTTRARRPITRLHLCGGGARLGRLDEFLTEALGIEVRPLALSDDRAFPEDGELAPGSLALALALQGVAASNAPRLTFRRGEFAFTRTIGEVRGRIMALGAMAAVLLVLFFASTFARLSALETREAQLDEQLCLTTQKILKTCETDFRVALGKLRGTNSPVASLPEVSAVQLSNALSTAFPEGSDATLDDLDIVDNTVRLRGDAKSYEAVDDLVDRMTNDRCFRDVRKGRLVKAKNGDIEFDLDATYTCGAGKARS